MSDDVEFQRAVRLHEQGDLHEAEQLYRQILRADSSRADVWNMLGLLAHQVGQNDGAVNCIQQAIRLSPQTATYHQNLAMIHHKLGRLEQAAVALTEVARLQPQNLQVHAILADLYSATKNEKGELAALRAWGAALVEQKRTDEAMAIWQRALALRPTSADLLNNLGVALMETGRVDEAIDCYRRALAAHREVPELHNNLGNALLAKGDSDAAVAAYREALRIKPNYPKCSNNLAMQLMERGSWEEAVRVLREAVRLRPDLPELCNNLGVALKGLGQLEQAMAAYRQALTSNPEFVDAHHNLGNLFLDWGYLDKAQLAFETALRLRPDQPEYFHHLALTFKRQGNDVAARQALEQLEQLAPGDPITAWRSQTLCPATFESRDKLDANRAALEDAIRTLAPRLVGVPPLELVHSHAEFPFNVQFFSGNLRPLREAYAKAFEPLFNAPSYSRPRSGKPRIGFLVTKGHEGVFLKSMRGVIERLDPELGEPVILASPAGLRRIGQSVQREALAQVALPDRADRMVAAIEAAQLDVLYHWEVGTDSANYFLPMFRLAPVQCTSWGLQLTSGMSAIDYYLSSTLVEPADGADHYSEKLLLADTLLTYQYRPAEPPAPPDRAEFGLRDTDHVYVCAQHLGKFHPDFDALIEGILTCDPHGVLVVTEDRYRVAAEVLRRRFALSLPEVSPRIRWLPRLPEEKYRSLIAVADVLLDPPHFGGVNSTYDGLALGKPIVTLPGPYHRGRYTLGCYRKMQIDDCIATDADDYVRRAVRLATDRDHRRAVEQKIAAAREVLFEDAQAVREHERLFEILVATARSG